MPKVKAGTLKPAIDQLKTRLREKGESVALPERRAMSRRLKRLQRKARRIHTEEERRAKAAAKPSEDASAATAAEAPAEESAAAPES